MSRYANASGDLEKMTQRDNILQELNELKSPLATHNPENIYTVPTGYFEGFAATVLARIRALEATHAAGELACLSPWLSKLPAQMPYAVPAGYFEELSEKILHLVRDTNDQHSVEEETASISPLLGSLKKEMPYHVPQGYFENLANPVTAEEKRSTAKVIALGSRKWFRYAAAAVVTGIIAIAGFTIINSESQKAEGSKVFAKVSKDINKLNDTQQNDLIDFLDAGMNGTETAKVKTDNRSKEIQQLLQDIPEDELKNFQEQTEDIEEVLMTN